MSVNSDIDAFIKKQEERVGAVQKGMARDVLDELFSRSPHFNPIDFKSDGEYDANHKISVNGLPPSPHHAATHSRMISSQAITVEKSKASGIKCGDNVVVINDTPHAGDVEYGGWTWIRKGYATFSNAKRSIKKRYSNVLK